MSNLADGMLQITLPLVTLGITRDPGAFAAVTFVERLPWLLFALHAGALADRLDRRRTMTLVNLGATLLAAFAATSRRRRAALTLYCWPSARHRRDTIDTAEVDPPTIVADKAQLEGQRSAHRRRADHESVHRANAGALVAAAALVSHWRQRAAHGLASVALLTLVGQFRAVRSGPPT